jgi:pSer/pThr/pTyr-binding forkhead associated (FHA) protein/ribosomal protein L40E
MTVAAGIVCGKCDRLNPVDSPLCAECENPLALFGAGRQREVDSAGKAEKETGSAKREREIVNEPPEAATQGIEGEPMEQARHYICKSCYSPVPVGHKFCGKCGTPVPEEAMHPADPNYFGDLQAPGKAKLILIKGEGMDGISYHLNSVEHIAGRKDGPILFTEDKWLSPKHASFLYRDGQLVVSDLGSVNGVFMAIQGAIPVAPGAVFMAGEQVFRVETVDPFDDEPESDGTYFFASPRVDAVFRIVQVLEGGGDGMVVYGRDGSVVVGRDNCDMNFPNDPYMSGAHLTVEAQGGSIALTDTNSKNGTYLRIDGEQALKHGDYVFLGRQLLRVEITA